MFQLGLVDIIVAEREREIETAIRRRRLMKPEDGATEPSTSTRRSGDGRVLTIRARPTGG
jgi:hypothetical protein